MKTRKCKSCGNNFKPSNNNAYYCCVKCRLLGNIIIDPKTGCWNCSYYSHSHKVPQIKIEGKCYGASHISYKEFIGPISKGKFVLHTCDNHYCVNPKHLFLGTHQDNMDDMYKKGRGIKAKGEKHGNSKLTDEQVRYIRMWAKEGFSQTSIAKAFKLSKSSVNWIVKRKTWTHVEEIV